MLDRIKSSRLNRRLQFVHGRCLSSLDMASRHPTRLRSGRIGIFAPAQGRSKIRFEHQNCRRLCHAVFDRGHS